MLVASLSNRPTRRDLRRRPLACAARPCISPLRHLLPGTGMHTRVRPLAAISGASNNGSSGSSGASQQQQAPSPPPTAGASPSPADAAPGAVPILSPIYIVIFAFIFIGGMMFAIMSLQLTSDLGFADACVRITRRVFRSIAFRQLVVISVAIFLVRFALNNVLKLLAQWSSSPVPWDKSKVYYVMKEVGGDVSGYAFRPHTFMHLCYLYYHRYTTLICLMCVTLLRGGQRQPYSLLMAAGHTDNKCPVRVQAASRLLLLFEQPPEAAALPCCRQPAVTTQAAAGGVLLRG